MRATVDIGEEDVTQTQRLPTGGWFKKYETITQNLHYHTVTTTVELTEEERAIIRNYNFSQEVLDDRPAHSREDIEQYRGYYAMDLTKASDFIREQAQQNEDEAVATYAAERDQTSIADLLKQPFKRQCNNARDAAEYADRMKTKILPSFSALLKKHADVPKSETLEF